MRLLQGLQHRRVLLRAEARDRQAEHVADGDTLQRFKDFDVFAYERLGGAHLLVGLNNNPDARTITVFTGFGANIELHDYVGHGADVRTDGVGQATIRIPPNTNGSGYVCYSRPGLGRAAPSRKHGVTQMFEGAQDLDIKPATPGEAVEIARLFCEAGTPIRGALNFDERDFAPSTRLTLELLDSSGTRLGTRAFAKGEQGRSVDAVAAATGFHVFVILASDTPETNRKPRYELTANYQAPQT